MSNKDDICIGLHIITFIFLLAVLIVSCVLFHRAILEKETDHQSDNQTLIDLSAGEAYSVLHSYYEDLHMPPIKDIVMKPMDDSILCPSNSYTKEVLFTYPKIESGCLCGKQLYNRSSCLISEGCSPITPHMENPFTNFRKSKFCINRYKVDEYKWAIPGVWFCEPSNLFIRWGLSLCLKLSIPTAGNHVFAGVTQGTEGVDFDQNADTHKVKFMMVNQSNAGLFDVIGLKVGVGRAKPCSSPNKGGYTPNPYPPSKLFFSDCGRYGSKEYGEPLNAQLDNERLQPLKRFFASNNWLAGSEPDFISTPYSPPNFNNFFTNTEQITLYQIKRPPEGADPICRNVKDKDFKIKINMNLMEDVDYIYNLSLTNIILCCLGIALIPLSVYLLNDEKNPCLYVCIKILCFSIAIICFVQADLYWKAENKNPNFEDAGDGKSTIIKQLINKDCFVDPVDPINNFKLKNVLKAAQDLNNAQELAIANSQSDNNESSDFYPGILFLFIWSIIWFIILFIGDLIFCSEYKKAAQ